MALPQRTGGWQFVLDPVSRLCLGAKEHLVNECMADKMNIVKDVMEMASARVTAPMHDNIYVGVRCA